jgi:hypothetical protein
MLTSVRICLPAHLSRFTHDMDAVARLDHVFVAFQPPNELHISNIVFQSTIEELREQIFPMWPPGVASQSIIGNQWHVKFSGSPWDSKGRDYILYA